MADSAPTAFLIVLAVLYLSWGTAQTLSLKWADTIDASDGFTGPAGDGASHAVHFRLLYSFAHPFTQAFFMFCAETSCFVVFVCMLLWKRYAAPWLHRVRGGSGGDAPTGELVAGEDYALPCNPCVWLLPSGADFLASIIQNVGMTLTYASVYQMLRGATVVWIAIISYFWLGRRFTKVELWGMGSVVLGLSLVGLSNLLSRGIGATGGGEGAMHKNQALGNLLVVSAQILHAYQGVCEERLVRLYKIPPLQMVGTEGIYGIGMTLSLLAFLQLVPMATWGHNLAAVEEFPAAGGPGVVFTDVSWVRQLQPALKVPYDDVVLAFAQVRESWMCKLFILVYVPAGFFYNACQMSIIKYVSAAATVMLGSLRNVTVWLVCLLIPSVFEEHFNVVQFIGFLFLVFGNVLFQRVWISSFDAVLPAHIIDAYPLLFRDAQREEVALVGAAEERSDDVTPEPRAVAMTNKSV
ncbi:EamA-like transporter family [Novymonas esmeraldas]|uniref:EamA-like transporter family n=1 Tax=Novymonas esmeraldas TaxID=1808958 RepID=A0AAW0ET37_9TRYP